MCTKHKKRCSKEKEGSWCQERKLMHDMALPPHLGSLPKHAKIHQFPLPKLELAHQESVEIPALWHPQVETQNHTDYLICVATGFGCQLAANSSQFTLNLVGSLWVATESHSSVLLLLYSISIFTIVYNVFIHSKKLYSIKYFQTILSSA